MTRTDAPTATRPQGRNWLVTLCGAGVFIILIGTLLPRMVSLPSLPEPADGGKAVAGNSKSEASPSAAQPATPAAGAFADKLEPVIIGASVFMLVGMATAWYLRHRRAAKEAVATGMLQLSAALPMRFNCCAYLVEIGGRNLLVGVDPLGIKTVIPLPSTLAEPESNEEPPALPSANLGANLRLISEGATA